MRFSPRQPTSTRPVRRRRREDARRTPGRPLVDRGIDGNEPRRVAVPGNGAFDLWCRRAMGSFQPSGSRRVDPPPRREVIPQERQMLGELLIGRADARCGRPRRRSEDDGDDRDPLHAARFIHAPQSVKPWIRAGHAAVPAGLKDAQLGPWKSPVREQARSCFGGTSSRGLGTDPSSQKSAAAAATWTSPCSSQLVARDGTFGTTRNGWLP
jgi:hypothetical protein